MNFIKSERVSPSFGHQRISSNVLPNFSTMRPLQPSSNIVRKKSLNKNQQLIIDTSPELRNVIPTKSASTKNIFAQKKKSIVPLKTLENLFLQQKKPASNLKSMKENINTNDQKQRNLSRSEHQQLEQTIQHQKTKSFQPKQGQLDIVCEEKFDFEQEVNVIPIEQQLKEFNPPEHCGFDEETLKYLYEREALYSIDPASFNKQQLISWQMRGVLVDWLIEVCREFTLKRETFYLTIQNMDRYLLKTLNQTKAELQLVGVTCLYIACKIEEIYPMKVADFEQACSYGFTKKQILEKELHILKTLQWQINPPTLYLWANWYMCQWDIYYKEQVLPKTNKKSVVLEFKKTTNQSYFIFRQFMTLLDCSILDINTFQYSNRELISSLMYLVLLKQYLGLTYSKISDMIQLKSQVRFDKDLVDFQQFYRHFIELCFGFPFLQIQKCLKYLSTFLSLEIVINHPNSSKIPSEKELEENYEYFLSIQTHNPNNLAFFRGRKRD